MEEEFGESWGRTSVVLYRGGSLCEKCIITYLREQMTLYCFTFVIFLLQGSRMICSGEARGR